MTSTGKKARKRYGNRFAAKQRKDSGTSTSRRSRKRFGKLAYSCEANNVPEGAVRANDDLLERVGRERAQNGWDQDANVMVPGPTRASVDARIRAEEQAQKDAEKAVRRAAKKARDKGGK